MTIVCKAGLRVLGGMLLLGALLFLPAGTLAYNNAWLLIGLLFIPMLVVCVILFIKDKALLEKRLKTDEGEKEQKIVLLISFLQFFVCFLSSGFDFRFGWSHFPDWLTVVASALFLTGYALYTEVLRENVYLSRTVEIQENQKVIDTGLYSLVRHPMYFATVILFWAMPLVLGSWLAFVIMLPYPLVLVKRIRNEETVLENGLTGYWEYKQKVKYRLIPYIW